MRRLTPDGGLPAHPPDDLADAVAARWKTLSVPARELTRLVALGGGPVDVDVLRQVVTSSASWLGPASPLVAEGVTAGVLTLSRAGRVWFRHPLLADLLRVAPTRVDPRDRPRRLRRGHRGPHPPARRDPRPGRRRRPASPRRRRRRPRVPMGGAGGRRGRAAVGVDGRRRRLGAGLLAVARRVRRGAGGEPGAARAAAPSGARCPALRRPRPAARVPGPRSGMRRRDDRAAPGQHRPHRLVHVVVGRRTPRSADDPAGGVPRSRADRRCAGQPRTGGGAGRAGHRPRVERRGRARGRPRRCA